METKLESRILVCGDSITRGVIFDEQSNRYINTKKAVTDEVAQKMHLTIDNMSKFGNTVKRALNSFKKAIINKKYKYVLFELGGNDCDFNWKAVADNPEGTHAPNTDYTEYKNILKEMIETARENEIVPVLATLPPIDAHRYFDWISSFSVDAKPHILSWLGDVNRIYWWQERYNAAVLQVASETHCRVLDIRSALLETDDYRKLYCLDGIHPNEKGHEVMANAVISSLRRINPDLFH
ncbi:MAG: SGNH/GDSL hydrolase family protein [Clostridia bacterium]|nr:SGNH/GDSL hydrolase family protein [Clostridia bacterium]